MIPVAPAALLLSSQLTHPGPVDILTLAMYFVLAVFIGFYVKGSTNASEEFVRRAGGKHLLHMIKREISC